MVKMFYGGVEGGATHSKLVICDEKGDQVVTVDGSATNHWMIGIPECANRIAAMVSEARMKADIPSGTRLRSLGLSLSGCEDPVTNKRLEDEIRSKQLADHYVICSDTLGSIATATATGGLVLISGTGSNAFLRNPDGETFNCGGWGHMLGDEGGAWWISQRVIKVVFDEMDNFNTSPADISIAWKLICEHFDVQTRNDLLQHFYANFQKSKCARLCERLSVAADAGDLLCRWAFNEAGKQLARMARTLLLKSGEKMRQQPWVDLVCVGSVWKSWHLMRGGFEDYLTEVDERQTLRLVRLTRTMGLGAMYLAADAMNEEVPRDYEQNVKEFYRLVPGALKSTNGHVDAIDL